MSATAGPITLATALFGPVDLSVDGIVRAYVAHRDARPIALTPAGLREFAAAHVEGSTDTGIRTSIPVGQCAKETGYLRFGNQVRPEQFNYAGIGATNDGAAGNAFATIREGVLAVYAHHLLYTRGATMRWPAPLREKYGRLALRERQVGQAGFLGKVKVLGDYVNGRWAFNPAKPYLTLANGYAESVAVYANTILARAGEGGAVTRGRVPKPPIDIIHVAKEHGHGCYWQDKPRTIVGTCWHSMVGTLLGTLGHFRRADVDALTDYGVGRADHGGGFARIIEYNDPLGPCVPWASGWGDEGPGIEGDGQAFLDRFGRGAINASLVSIERDDGGKADAPVTAPQWASLCWLTAYYHDLAGQTAETFAWNMHHKEFAKKDCPHPAVYNHTNEYQAVVRAIMRHFQAGVAYPAGGLRIAGLPVAVPVALVEPGRPVSPGTVDRPDVWIPVETGMPVAHGFLAYFREFGGLRAFGYPLTREIAEDGRTVQYFERARMEHRPGMGLPHDVELGQVGRELLTRRAREV